MGPTPTRGSTGPPGPGGGPLVSPPPRGAGGRRAGPTWVGGPKGLPAGRWRAGPGFDGHPGTTPRAPEGREGEATAVAPPTTTTTNGGRAGRGRGWDDEEGPRAPRGPGAEGPGETPATEVPGGGSPTPREGTGAQTANRLKILSNLEKEKNFKAPKRERKNNGVRIFNFCKNLKKF